MRTDVSRTNFYSEDTFTAGTDDPATAEDFNDILDKECGLGRPLGRATVAPGPRLILPVLDASVTADQVIEALTSKGVTLELRKDRVSLAGTRIHRPPQPGGFFLAGRDMPHGFESATLAAGRHDPVPWKRPAGDLRRPVVALLDSGVQDHAWFPEHDPDDPFLLDAETVHHPWVSPVGELGAVDRRHGAGDEDHKRAEAGHATFMAGIIRAAAPSARVLSVRVMSEDGKVRESIVTSALKWLIDYVDDGRPLDVVCMAFGREPGDHSDLAALDEMEVPLRELAARGVALVASAGNDHVGALDGEQIFPAAFDMVTAVGAGFSGYHTAFSNHGAWVDRYRDGVEVVSTYLDNQWARWSGTSFAAAAFAGDLARPHVV